MSPTIFFSQTSNATETIAASPYILMALAVGLFVACSSLTIVILVRYYKRCPSNRLLVVYTKTSANEESICVTKRSRLVLPFLQKFSYLSLDPMKNEVMLSNLVSTDNQSVNLTATLTAAVGTTEELMQNAGQWLGQLEEDEIMKLVEDVITLRSQEVVATLPIDEIRGNRNNLVSRIQGAVEPDLARIGIVPLGFNVSDS